jgi:hypothetical protein
MPSRPMNAKASNDHDFVPPETYKPSKRPLPSELLALEALPYFEPMSMQEILGRPRLPNISEPEDIYRLFFNNRLIDLMVNCTNENAKIQRAQYTQATFRGSQRPWISVDRSDMLTYLGIIIYMGIHIEPHQNMYWNTHEDKGPIHHVIRKSMGLKRWEQIHRYLHIWDSSVAVQQIQKPHQKAEFMAQELRTTFRTYWEPGTHVSVDECIEGFCGRSPDIVNIPTKPTPIGYKIWVLAEAGYILDFLFHVRGGLTTQDPQGLQKKWLQMGFSKTQAVVLELLTRMKNNGQNHTVWLDNLFISERLLQTLRDYGIGGAGTVRTSSTKRENQNASQDASQDASQNASQNTSISKGFGINPILMEAKIRFKDRFQWGRFFSSTSLNKQVLHFAWKDANVVLFMSTIDLSGETVERLRRRSTNAKSLIQQTWKGQSTKKLHIPKLIDMYNHHMNGVDRADQLRSYYRFKRRQFRTWKPLFHFLLQTTISNAARLWIHQTEHTNKRSAHLLFRTRLVNALMEHTRSESYIVSENRGIQSFERHITQECRGSLVHLNKTPKECKACQINGRIASVRPKRKALDLHHSLHRTYVIIK